MRKNRCAGSQVTFSVSRDKGKSVVTQQRLFYHGRLFLFHTICLLHSCRYRHGDKHGVLPKRSSLCSLWVPREQSTECLRASTLWMECPPRLSVSGNLPLGLTGGPGVCTNSNEDAPTSGGALFLFRFLGKGVSIEHQRPREITTSAVVPWEVWVLVEMIRWHTCCLEDLVVGIFCWWVHHMKKEFNLFVGRILHDLCKCPTRTSGSVILVCC